MLWLAFVSLPPHEFNRQARKQSPIKERIEFKITATAILYCKGYSKFLTWAGWEAQTCWDRVHKTAAAASKFPLTPSILLVSSVYLPGAPASLPAVESGYSVWSPGRHLSEEHVGFPQSYSLRDHQWSNRWVKSNYKKLWAILHLLSNHSDTTVENSWKTLSGLSSPTSRAPRLPQYSPEWKERPHALAFSVWQWTRQFFQLWLLYLPDKNRE